MKTWFQVALFATAFFSAVALADSDTFGLGTGRDGPLVVTEAGRVVNRYTQMTGPAAPGDAVLLVDGTEGFGVGDLVLVLQVTGLVPEPRPGLSGPIALSNDPVGRWELARLADVGNGTLTLRVPLMHSYAARVTQIIRVPEYTDVHVQRDASLRAVPWNGGTGGVVAFLATGTVRNDGEISATGAGFRGGRYAPDGSDPVRCMGMAVVARPGARKGEGVAVTQYGPMKTGRESVTNGGGGGVCPMAGGGGGGHGGPGGRGGWSADMGEGFLDIGGQGGAKLVHSMFDRLSFGGGGGSGHGEDWSGPEGGAGGGVIFIRAFNLSGMGSITADGEAGGSANVGGGSGGGAGGDVHLRFMGSAECGSVSARGGAGGNTVAGFMGGGGPGGGGGGGRVLLLAESSGDCLPSSEAGLAGSSPDLHEVRSSSGPGRGAQPTMDALTQHAGLVVWSLPGSKVSSDPIQPPEVKEPLDGAFINTNRGFTIKGKTQIATTVKVYISLVGNPVPVTKTADVSSDSWTVDIQPGDDPFANVIDGDQYVIKGKAENVSGGFSDFSNIVTFTVDLTAPDTNIVTAKPPPLSNSTEATFTFTSDETGVTYQCALDGPSYSSCDSGKTYPGLSHGPHSFSVRAVDKAGNVDDSPATYSWIVDTEKPDTSIGTKPSPVTSSTSATFTFSSADSDVERVECSLGKGAYATCISPKTYPGLSQGLHSFDVRAVDKVGNVDDSPATYSWTVDTVVPDTSIGTKPSPVTSSTSATFTFSSTDINLERFECSLDKGAYATCTSGKTYTGLSQGLHSFDVRAVDKAGNVDDSPATYSWTVDTEKPDTSIGTKPSPVTSSTSATFTFSSADSDVERFECSLDKGAYATCISPKTYPGLSQGLHSFDVRAADKAGNKDESPATYSWTVDTDKPETSIGMKPPMESNSTEATFTFSSANSDVERFECSLDKGAYATCTSPKTYTGLSQGPHSFAVRAVDKAGNVDDSPATYPWTVDTVAPEVRIHTKPPVLANSTEAKFTFSSAASDVERFECALDNADFKPCPSEGVTYSGLSQGSHSFSVQALDKAGNASPARYNWIVDTVAPKVQDLTPAMGARVNTQTPIITGWVDESRSSTVRVYIDGKLAGELLADASVTWSFRSPTHLANGTHTVSAEATDEAGNAGPRTLSQTFTVDTEPPDTRIVEGPPPTHNSKLAAFVFESIGEASGFECELDANPFAACGAESLFSGLANGPHKLRVRAKDLAGNVDPEPAVYEWYVLVELPRSPEISDPADGAEVNTRTPGISGTAVVNGSVTVYINDKKNGVALVDESGHWNFRPPEPLEDGVYSLTAEATDVAGNTSENRSQARVFTVRYTAGEPLRSIGGGLSCAASGADASLSLVSLGGLLLLSARRRHRR